MGVLGVGLAVLVSACAPGAPDAAAVAAGQARAAKVLDNWAASVQRAGGATNVAVVGNLTGQVGDWEMPFGDNGKRALMAGMVVSEGTLGGNAPASGTVTWQDGSTATVPILGVQDSLAAIARAGMASPCGDCQPLIAERASLVQAAINTTRGPATGPVWEFTIRGTAVKITHVAIANAIVPAALEDSPGGVMSIDSANGSATSSSVTVSFVGAPGPASEPCGEDYTADAVESDLAVTVLVWRHPHVTVLPEGCALVGARRTATATLAKPLGDRPVLDPATGLAVPLTLRP